MSKYHNKKTVIDNITFDSKKEANRYVELKLLEKSGKIKHLTLQPKFLLQEDFIYKGEKIRKICYVADFQYKDKGNNTIVEDVKGMKTQSYLIKKKIFLYKYRDFTSKEI
jgi:hypothetical protein